VYGRVYLTRVVYGRVYLTRVVYSPGYQHGWCIAQVINTGGVWPGSVHRVVYGRVVYTGWYGQHGGYTRVVWAAWWVYPGGIYRGVGFNRGFNGVLSRKRA